MSERDKADSRSHVLGLHPTPTSDLGVVGLVIGFTRSLRRPSFPDSRVSVNQ